MSRIISICFSDIAPPRHAVFEHQGIPAERAVPAQIGALFTTAVDLLNELASPVGVLADIPRSAFEEIYRGEGRNETHTPVADILPLADDLALFAATLGEPVSREITDRFKSGDLAVGAMLDAAASVAADRLADAIQDCFCRALSERGRMAPTIGVLRYSPGYCGWHISGQRRLFDELHPEQIGITLRESFLMQPLKSVSGVLIAGPKQIHDFEDTYPFCAQCKTHNCRERIRSLLGR
jgi:hypothetical protein